MTPSASSRRFSIVAACLLTLAVVLRAVGASHTGDQYDISINQGWAKSFVLLGFSQSYTKQVDGNMLPNHAPLSIATFGLMGHIHRAVFSPEINTLLPVFRLLIKVPAMVADILTAIALGIFVTLWRSRKAGLIALAVYAFHPAVLYESTIWGQTDALPTLFIILAIGALAWERPWLAGMCGALAVLYKAQAVSLLPVLAIPLLLRPMQALRAIGGGLLTSLVVFLPLILGGTAMAVLSMYTSSVGFYPILSSAAYNFWWTLFLDAAGSKPSTDLMFGLMSYRTIGVLLYACFTLWSLWATRHLWQSSNPRERWEGLMLSGTVTAYAFFLFNTEMHERYLFPLMALGLPLLFRGRRMALTYIAASIAFLFNLMGYLQFGALDKALHREFPGFDGFIAYVNVACFLLIVTWIASRAPAARA